jgi:23S rRNA (adenine2503-C2)-methyltransferase
MENSAADRPTLLGMSLGEIEALASRLGLPRYAGGQIASWVYRRRAESIDAMTDLSSAAREALAREAALGAEPPARVSESSDGTRKYLFASRAGRFVEAAWIPEGERGTLCLSVQVGCKMGCLFCMTGRQGFQGNLSAGEILNQYRSLPERDRVTNIVYMGMGEPMDNLPSVLASLEAMTRDWGFGLAPRRITVSTIGIIPAMREFLERSRCHLAVSLHSPFEEERRRLMPVETVYPLAEVLAALRDAAVPRRRRVSFEYIMFRGLNDTPAHARELVRLLHGIRARVNLIPFHPLPVQAGARGIPLEPSPRERMEEFQARLAASGVTTTIRKSRGLDIAAACGLLSTRALVKPAGAPDW